MYSQRIQSKELNFSVDTIIIIIIIIVSSSIVLFS
jgi:hypothetical protein